MLGTKPSHDGAAPGNPTYNLADATTHIMWTCALAAARAAFVSTARGLAFWSQMLPPPLPLSVPRTPSAPDDPEAAAAASAAASPHHEPAVVGAASDEPPAFASYRSAGGHAAAQVTISPLSVRQT